MKVIFDRDELISAISPAAGIVPSRNTSTVLEGILLECDKSNGNCVISAYDMEKGMRTNISANIIEEGSVILNTSKLLQIARVLPQGEIDIEINDKMRCVISAGSSSFEIAASSGDDFPALPLLSGDKNYTLPQYKLRNLINRAIFAVSQNDQRPAFTGLLFKIDGGNITVVGVDGSRLAISEADAPEESVDAQFIVPAKILTELMKLIKDTEDDVTISLARKHVIFSVGEIYYFSRLIETEYVDYTRAIPKSHVTEVFINMSQFKAAIERALLISEDKLGGSYHTFVKLDFSGNTLKVSADSTSGSVYEEVPIAMNGEDMLIGFNCRFLAEALKACPDNVYTLRIRMSAPLLGAVIEDAECSGFVKEDADTPVPESYRDPDGDEKERERFIYLVMPCRMTK